MNVTMTIGRPTSLFPLVAHSGSQEALSDAHNHRFPPMQWALSWKYKFCNNLEVMV